MKLLLFVTILGLLAACSTTSPLPTVSISNPDDPAAPAADRPYRAVMAGTVDHGIGDRP